VPIREVRFRQGDASGESSNLHVGRASVCSHPEVRMDN
jgi:hypothetical protein